mgnify:CR=1 FL=1
MRGVIQIPGLVGGASWAGAAVDPGAGIIYIPSYTNPAILTLKKAPDGSLHEMSAVTPRRMPPQSRLGFPPQALILLKRA